RDLWQGWAGRAGRRRSAKPKDGRADGWRHRAVEPAAVRKQTKWLVDLSPRFCLAVLLTLCAIGFPATPGAACDLAHAPASRWSVHAENGTDWLVDPCGERFYSVGINVLDSEVPKQPLTDGRVRYEWRRFY